MIPNFGKLQSGKANKWICLFVKKLRQKVSRRHSGGFNEWNNFRAIVWEHASVRDKQCVCWEMVSLGEILNRWIQQLNQAVFLQLTRRACFSRRRCRHADWISLLGRLIFSLAFSWYVYLKKNKKFSTKAINNSCIFTCVSFIISIVAIKQHHVRNKFATWRPKHQPSARVPWRIFQKH